MIHRLHYRYLNDYLAFYYYLQHQSLNKIKALHKEKTEHSALGKTKTKLISALA